ncbi:MAG: pilus assembly protein PilM [Desulfuromonas sp.]|uniref:type IV pilus biogenesis protein PilM n=1 Tax=Desulfuromonas sp. TaxID=892 RepID=UPI000CB39787|nr:type IV pilus assembly protein PilM [Desulfuromonas sp.]PLX85737.1 MAG: pilus assembly protein PilM [Desulfuromonas sp.]
MLFRTSKDIVGIDIGSSSVKMVQLREAKGGYHLVDLGIAPLPPEAIVDNAIMDSSSVVDVIRNLVESHKVKTKNVATSISGHSVIIRKIQLPMMSQEEMESSIQWEAEQYIPFEISEVNLDFQILGPDENDPSQMNVILVAAKKDFVNEYVAVFRECGLNPQVMDIYCFALENAFETNYGVQETGVVALINMGASAMNVSVLRGGVAVFTRDIQVGGNMLNEEIQKRLGLSHEDAETVKLGGEVEDADPVMVSDVLSDATENLAQEVQRSLDFFAATSSDEQFQKLYIAGGVSMTPQVLDVLEKRLGFPVELLDPFRQVEVNEKEFDPEYIRAVGPLFPVAVGLAMRKVGDK